jgi:hypothetical protein
VVVAKYLRRSSAVKMGLIVATKIGSFSAHFGLESAARMWSNSFSPITYPSAFFGPQASRIPRGLALLQPDIREFIIGWSSAIARRLLEIW